MPAHWQSFTLIVVIFSLISASGRLWWANQQKVKSQPLETYLSETIIEEDENIVGTIKICLTYLDSEKRIRNGQDRSQSIIIPGLIHSNITLTNAVFTFPLKPNHDVYNRDNHLDAECQIFTNLSLGTYRYPAITPLGDGWEVPVYNDRFLVQQTHRFAPFDVQNPLSDGQIELSDANPLAILMIVLQAKSSPQTSTPLPESIACYFICTSDQDCRNDFKCIKTGDQNRCVNLNCPVDDTCSCRTTSTSTGTNSAIMTEILKNTENRYPQP